MRPRRISSPLQVQSQGRMYALVVGVTAGMLAVGLAVPVVFGHESNPGKASLGSTPGGSLSATATAMPTASASASPGSTSGTATTLRGGSVPTLGPGSSSGVSTSGAIATSGPTASGTLTASDVGVTPTSIKVGVVLLDIQALQPLGFGQPHFSPQEQRDQYQFFIDQANKAGGINGRRIVPDFKTYNALDTNGSQSAGAVCQQMADDKVFAVIGLNGDMASCLTLQHHIMTVTDGGRLAEAYSKSGGLLVSGHSRLERFAANWGYLASRSGLLNGHKLGTVHNVKPDEARPEQALVDALKAEGRMVTYRASLSDDPSTGQSQIPIEVSKMKAAGVDAVFLETNFVQAIQFAQTAERQGFTPQYLVSDLGALVAEGLVQQMPASFDGAYAWTESSNGPEKPADTECRADFNKATGQNLQAGNDSGGLRVFCANLKLFVAGAVAAGPRLTRAGMGAAYQGLANIDLPVLLGGRFGPGKPDYADLMRTGRYSSACKCYHWNGDSLQGRY